MKAHPQIGLILEIMRCIEHSFWLNKPLQYETSSKTSPADLHNSISIDFEYPRLTCPPSSMIEKGPLSSRVMGLYSKLGAVNNKRPPGFNVTAISLINFLSSIICSMFSQQIATSYLATKSTLSSNFLTSITSYFAESALHSSAFYSPLPDCAHPRSTLTINNPSRPLQSRKLPSHIRLYQKLFIGSTVRGLCQGFR